MVREATRQARARAAQVFYSGGFMKILIHALRAPGAVLVLMGLALSSAAQAQNLPDFTELVATHRMSVVNISTTQKQTTSARPQLPEGF
jgi:hypothetical protein